jgi:polyferredoxin
MSPEAGNVGRFDLLQIGWVRALAQSRALQPALIFVNLFIFVVLIMAGLVGTPVGNHNAAIVLVWILWFFLLVAVMIPIGGRIWCAMCPLPAPAEWIGRLGIVRKGRRNPVSLGRRWPKRLDNMWLQNLGFLTVCTFSPIILTRPEATSYLLLGLIGLAIVIGLVYVKQRRAGRLFCKYVCPVGGFIGLYSLMGAFELKVKDPKVCRADKDRRCITGCDGAWGCPWYEYPGNMDRNLYCGLCTECIKACTKDNLVLRFRPFGQDLLKKRRLDEAFKSFIMLGSGIMFVAVFFGWWGALKDLADPLPEALLKGPFQWGRLALYTVIFWGLTLGVLPGLGWAAAWVSRWAAADPTQKVKALFVDYAYALVPLGLMAWVAFVLGMAMVNGSYVISVVSDPFGWGWDLFGTANFPWTPFLPDWAPYLQAALLLVGLWLTGRSAYRLTQEQFPSRWAASRAVVPQVGLAVLIAQGYLYLFMTA